MSPQRRALIIALLGPVLEVAGLGLMLGAAAMGRNNPNTFRQLLFDPAFLILSVGVLVSLATLPVALAVYGATEEEVSPALFHAEIGAEAQGADEKRRLEAAE